MEQNESVKKEPAGLAADAAEAPSPEEAFRIIEACLFAAGHPLPLQKLFVYMTEGGAELHDALCREKALRGASKRL